MDPVVKRALFFISGFMVAFTAGLSGMEGGITLTPDQIGQVSLLTWGLSISGGVLGMLNGGQAKGGEK